MRLLLFFASALLALMARAQSPLWFCAFTNDNWLAEWNLGGAPSGKRNIPFGSTNIARITDAAAPGGAFLRITYPAGSYAPSGAPAAPAGGTQFYGAVLRTNGLMSADTIALQFALRFPSNFNFVLGGKLPGLYGGAGNTGDDYPDGSDGFTTRHMWREAGAGEAFPFLPNSPTPFGTSLGRGNWYFTGDSQWHTLRQDVVLNEVGESNGVLRVWYDSVLVLEATGLWFRTTNTLKLDGVLFQTFFGGGDPSNATPVTTHADFAAFAVYGLTNMGGLLQLSNYQNTVAAQQPACCFQLDNSLADSLNHEAELTVNGSGGGFANDYFGNPNRARFFATAADALIASSDLLPGGGMASAGATNQGSLSLLLRLLDSTNHTVQRFVLSQGNTTASQNAFGLFFENSSSTDPNSLKLRAGNTTTTLLTPTQLRPNHWYHFAATWNEARDDHELQWYLGPLGGALDSGTVDLANSAVMGDGGVFYIGNNATLNNGFANPGNGRVDELAVWQRELSAAEVAAQFQAVLPVPSLTIAAAGTNVVIRWPADGPTRYVLESATSLAQTGGWTFVSSGFFTGGEYRVTNAIDSSRRFYRLNTP